MGEYKNRIDKIINRIRKDYLYVLDNMYAYTRIIKAKGYKDAYESDSFYYKSVKALSSAFEQIEKKIFPEEIIVGYLPAITKDRLQEEELKFKKNYKVYWDEIKRGQYYYTAPEYRKILKFGLKNVYEQIEKKLKCLNPVIPDHIEKIEFFKSAKLSLEGFRVFCKSYSDLAKDLSKKEKNTKRKRELLEISRICNKVPFEPATSFHEALQSVYFIYIGLLFDMVDIGVSFGRFDRYLDTYLENDLKKGKITEEHALFLMRNFLAKLNERSSGPMSIMIGGSIAKGKPYCSRTTKLIMEATDKNRLVAPALGVAFSKDTDKYLWEKSVEMLASGFSHPALFGEETIVKGLRKIGVIEKDAYEFVHTTCTEITIPGKSFIGCVAHYMNSPKVFEYIWYRGNDRNGKKEGIDTGDLSEFNAYEKFFKAVKSQLSNMIYQNIVMMNRFLWRRMQFEPKPFTSCLVDDCINREKDISSGGAVYNFFYPQLVGVANVVDSLLTIKKLVYEKKEVSLLKFKSILEKNFNGFETIRQNIINNIPKYGTDDNEADKLAREIMDFYYDEVLKYRTALSRYYPGTLAATRNGMFGLDCMATPDGRLAKEALADSMAAMQGRAKKGITAILNSANKLDLYRFIGAVVVNLHLQSSFFKTDEHKRKFAELIKTHLLNGGFEVQVTVVSAEELKKAKKEPEKYRDLIVRIAGYSDYFVRLSPEVQDAIIHRASV